MFQATRRVFAKFFVAPAAAVSFNLFLAVCPFAAIVLVSSSAPVCAVVPPELPEKILWAWRRPEDLSMIDPKQFGVAYLAAHVRLSRDGSHSYWRDQPLQVPRGICLIPVVRLEIDRDLDMTDALLQKKKLVEICLQAASRPGIRMFQLDFDALQSQRAFYKSLLTDLRASLSPKISISITALASWCLFDSWIKGLPVDETVPMMFSLGPEREKIILYFSTAKDFIVSGCCDSLGLSLEDSQVDQLMIPLAKKRKIPVRYYIFTKTAWNKAKLQKVSEMLK